MKIMYELLFTSDARNDFKKIKKSLLKDQIYKLLDIVAKDPFTNPPPYKKLQGLYFGAYSRRINLKHRLFYQVDAKTMRAKILRMWSHYGDN
jgi:Txe/YoeB family toxin of toxin-antitoxin system